MMLQKIRVYKEVITHKTKMKRNWKEIVSKIYPQVKPISGQLFSSIGQSFMETNKIDHIWIELLIKGFTYEDPWYGEFGPYPEYHMSIEPNLNNQYIAIDTIKELENFVLIPEKNDQIGWFSNSLDFVVHKLNFGKIENGMIDLIYDYSFTNNYGYGNMDGTIEEHITEKGHFKTQLKIRELHVAVPNQIKPMDIIQNLNQDIYDINNFRIGKVPEDLNWTAPHSKGYIVPYKKELNTCDNKA